MPGPREVERPTRPEGRARWKALYAAALGWLFDGYEGYVLVLVAAVAVRDVVPPDQLHALPTYIGGLLGATLLGWATGGVVSGVLSDYIGRKRTLMLSILCYALFTGLTAFAHSYAALVIFRFMTGLGLGGEWGPGAALVGRKPTTWLFFLGAPAAVWIVFLLVHDPILFLVAAMALGFWTSALFAWMPIYLPELFPTAVRGSAMSLVFNATRYVAALGPLAAGWAITTFGGIASAASIMALVYVVGPVVTPFAGPETKGQPLPE